MTSLRYNDGRYLSSSDYLLNTNTVEKNGGIDLFVMGIN
jgi:hypothetical protein